MVFDDVAQIIEGVFVFGTAPQVGTVDVVHVRERDDVFLVCPALTSASSALPTLKSMALLALWTRTMLSTSLNMLMRWSGRSADASALWPSPSVSKTTIFGIVVAHVG